MPQPETTIAAIATPPGIGGIAVIRISGPKAFGVAGEICFRGGKPLGVDRREGQTLHPCVVRSGGQTVDEVVVSLFRGPKSYTGEDVVEISCHGGVVTPRRIVELLVQRGVRLAGPGEFTQRAFLNGKLDLTQAEAVADLIHARSTQAAALALGQLEGSLGRRIAEIRDSLMEVLAHLEAHIDFPDEDISPETRGSHAAKCAGAGEKMEELLRTAREGQLVRQGVRTVISGRPNVGKSSLFNALLGLDRAIVTAQAGTTRDTLEEVINLGGVPLVLTDTAGLRPTTDAAEAEGVRRSQRALEQAELVLHVVEPAFEPEPVEDPRSVLVINKADLLTDAEKSGLRNRDRQRPRVLVSARTGEGLEELRKVVCERIGYVGQGEVLINGRHEEALLRARQRLAQVQQSLDERVTPELVAVDLRGTLAALGEVVGRTATEDLLDKIFSTFCIGK
ncbi:MAG: tRNA uridine-5-carboxymethylaminomethyl(34) synthesis GTPase MnmE [Verrucomicrobiae bacterium]|nr:tRNA uridine-5-carboxymethylaminomethyl(34) synthesis GTPase MnmE [Verrucomicrobiae bacterium]